MNGTTEYVAPSDICTQRLNAISVPIASGRTVCCENSMSARPSQKRIVPRNQTRPRRPHFRPHLSPTQPPSVRAKMFIRPKRPATRPAVASPRSKESWKYSAAMLLMVNSTPKHAP